MVAPNREDGAVRTTAEKPSTAGRQDGRVRTSAEKEASAAGFAYSYGTIF